MKKKSPLIKDANSNLALRLKTNLAQAAAHRPEASDAWLLQSPPGLAMVLKKEMIYVQALERKQDVFIKRQRNHDLIFANRLRAGDVPLPTRLSRLRVAEAVYRCPIFGRFKISKRQLDVAANEIIKIGPCRLVVQVAGRQFDRRDLGRWLEKEMAMRGAVLDSEIEAEVWMFCIDEAFYFAIPMQKAREVVGREERSAEREASLPGPIAAAMVFAAAPQPGDVILDPVCGSGTLLAEAKAYQPISMCIGVDIDPLAISAARENLGENERTVLLKADSRTVRLPQNDVTILLANLPFGVRFGDKKTNAALYTAVLQNALTQARTGRFRAILLSSDVDSLRTAMSALTAERKSLEAKDLFRVKIRGEVAQAVSLQTRRV